MAKTWVGFDLDGTLAYYDTWKGIDVIGPPIPLMVLKVKSLIKLGINVKIMTARVASNQKPEDITRATTAIEKWCEEYIGQKLPVTAEKDLYMTELYDDRAVTVEFNTGRIMGTY